MLKTEIKSLVSMGEMLPLMEAFYTIQGEGFHKGSAAYFIRIGGCDVGCHWCDVKESWDAGLHDRKTISELVNEVKKTAADIVIITGGEPLMQDCTELTNELKKEDYCFITISIWVRDF